MIFHPINFYELADFHSIFLIGSSVVAREENDFLRTDNLSTEYVDQNVQRDSRNQDSFS